MFRCSIPEGVEVKISSELVSSIVKDRFVRSVGTYPSSRYASSDPEGYPEFQNSVEPFKQVRILEVKNKGKFMYWSFSNDWYMMCTFGMSGQWSPDMGKHPCFHLEHTDINESDHKKIYFNDPRHFGTIKFVRGRKELSTKLTELGWDPLQDDLGTWLKYLTNLVRKSDKPIGQLLMDQTAFAGVGNYIRAEALYLAKISPWRIGKKLSVDEIKTLCESIVSVMQESYAYQGATIHTYKDSYGNEGRYSSCFKVYGQKKDPLGNVIVKEATPEGRSIHWCPSVQI